MRGLRGAFRPARAIAWSFALLALLPPVIGAAAVASAGAPSATAPPPGGSVSATVTWNGVPVGQATTPATAFVVRPGDSPLVAFTFFQPAGSPVVVNASLVLRFLGITLSDLSVPPDNVSGQHFADLNWSFGSLYELTEGIYEVTAELLDAQGAIQFQEAFYVTARAPYLVGSAVTAFLLVLGAAEVYWVAAVVLHRRARRRHWH